MLLEWLGNIIVVLLGLVGITEVVRLIVFWMLSPGRGEKMLIVVPVTGRDEEAEFVLRSAAQRVKWMGGKDEKRVLCVDCGMEEVNTPCLRNNLQRVPFHRDSNAGGIRRQASLAGRVIREEMVFFDRARCLPLRFDAKCIILKIKILEDGVSLFKR